MSSDNEMQIDCSSETMHVEPPVHNKDHLSTNSTNIEVDNNFIPIQLDSSQSQMISLWANKTKEEAKTRPLSLSTINNNIRDVNLKAKQVKLIELY
ncbi:1478_t:CDS:2 [Acaulospora colombiana]|uniref:1478_t:CDS:1 n=1 Tax=Acaulospora colombiana TaxID=27376 RepID=A0ACA9KV27_9GLOM|nr:1478_t:CDS:2 [Acaulospora colombiana]